MNNIIADYFRQYHHNTVGMNTIPCYNINIPIWDILRSDLYSGQVKNSIYSSEYQRFLKRLKEARLESGLTQSDVAKLLKQYQSYVSKCESGERRVDAVELVKYAKVYKKDIMFFLS